MSDMSNALDGIHTSGSLSEKAEICQSTKGNVSGFSHPALISLRPLFLSPNAQKNTATVCKWNRSNKGEDSVASPVPKPFPEPLPLAVSHSCCECLLPWTKASEAQVIKVYNEDNTSRAVEVPSDITARDVCQLFVLKNHCIDDHSWTLFEHLSHLGIERSIEDHESVLEVLSGWGMDTDSRLYFRKNYAKYEFFKKPLDFFPEHMVSISSEANGITNPSQLIQTFLNSSTCPEIHGHLHAKEQSRKSWKKFYFVMRRSGLYFSTKGTSKEPRHLQFIVDFSDSEVYTLLSAKKLHGAPTDYGFCVKYGTQLYQNFIQPHQKQKASPMRSTSENSLVAMDFSGQKSRVIENPSEALSVAVEEGLSWRRKSVHRLSSHGSPQSSVSNIALHLAQPWFHSKLSRDEAQRLITQQGLIDGVFLLRDSQSNPKTFVLSLCHMQRIKHFQILPVDDEGEVFYSLDDAHTRFTDLIQLVDFYQLNRGVLPCKLKHHCVRITL
ncbi:growth factor receptor-bound protein 14 isoform X2 [Thalassophryne amazonica]|uniref:growth factor receptor-bound protein 14 isoform X2 n=1 Tax=Thalassophryne amazonica TaxID=390379 RepID=UPI001471A94A|nr:growth factor receptor-bound protein 14 isoform X2 [Thalassophryne amazonica]